MITMDFYTSVWSNKVPIHTVTWIECKNDGAEN